ncbi:hypothetical protein EV360DRAFT_77010, partial [Lentinula raphanica]
MAPKGKGSSSGKTQGSSSRKIQFSAPLLDVTFHNILRARDSLLNSSDAILFLPSTPAETAVLQKLWRKFPNTLDSAFDQQEYEVTDDLDFPQSIPADYNNRVPTNFYLPELVQLYQPFASGPLCRVDASFLYRGLRLVQDAITEVQAANKSRAKTQTNIIRLLEDVSIQNALKHYRRFWHRSRSCPLFALRFICLFCDYCEKYLDDVEYTRLVYDESKSTGFGVSAALRTAVKNSIKSSVPTMATLAIPIPFDVLSSEGQLIIKVASAGSPPRYLKNPFTGQTLFPDPLYDAHAPPTTPPPRAGPSNEGIASPILSNEGIASPVGSPALLAEGDDLGETEASSEEVEGLDVFQGSRVRTHAGTDLGVTRSSASRPKPVKIGPPIGRPKAKPLEGSKPSIVVKVKRERPEAEKSDRLPSPVSKRQKTGKAAGKARAVTPPPQDEVDELAPEEVISEAAASSLALDSPLASNDLDISQQVSFLANPNYKPRIAFSTLVSPGHNLKRRPDHQVLRMPKWIATPELASVGSFLTAGNASFSISNLARFAHLTTRGIAPSTSPLDPDIAPTTDCVSCLIRGLTCRNGEQIGGPCAGCEQSHRTCPSALHMELQSDLLDIIPEAVRSLPGGFSESVGQLQEALNTHFRILENAGEIIQNSLL